MTDRFEPAPASQPLLLSSRPALQVLGLFLGALTTAHPIFIDLLPVAWIVPAAIAALVSLIRPARPVALGFAAASLAWATAYLVFVVIVVTVSVIR